MLYSDIVSLSLGYADRVNDTELAPLLDNMLRLVEAKINRFLSVQNMIIRTQVPMDINTELYDKPAGYNSIQSIFISPVANFQSRVQLEYRTSEQMTNIISNNLATYKAYYSIIGDKIQVCPLKDSTFNLNVWYFHTVPPLTSVDNSNWCSITNPDCYIAGLVAEINAYAKSLDGYTSWKQRFEDTMKEIDLNDQLVTSSTPLVIQIG